MLALYYVPCAGSGKGNYLGTSPAMQQISYALYSIRGACGQALGTEEIQCVHSRAECFRAGAVSQLDVAVRRVSATYRQWRDESRCSDPGSQQYPGSEGLPGSGLSGQQPSTAGGLGWRHWDCERGGICVLYLYCICHLQVYGVDADTAVDTYASVYTSCYA